LRRAGAAAPIVAAVAHRQFKARPISEYLEKLLPKGVIADVKSQFDEGELTRNGVTVWRL